MELAIDNSVKPVKQPYRRIPAPLEKKVNEKLDELLDKDIIEIVDTPSRWVSPMVIEPKKNGDIRVCLDMRQVNKAVQREIHPLPTQEEILSRIGDAKFFSKLDLEQGFHQVELAEESRHITTFICSKGLRRYKRLFFGINCAPEKFQKIMESLLAGCRSCINFIDDILIWGAAKEDHDKNLKVVLNRLKSLNVKLNEKKCIYGKEEVEFMGLKFSRHGINLTAEKLEAVKLFRAPNNTSELRSFLGFVNFMKIFIPDMSTATAPLNALLRTDQKFEWGIEQQNAFEYLKNVLGQDITLGYYDVNDRTEVVTDASPFGLGAVLIQKNEANEPRIIRYANRTLSLCERRYAQTEREALAIVWAVEKFHFYLYGKRFYIITDHKPLEVIFGVNSKPCLRIERWVLRLSSYNYRVIYKPGKQNIADVFSRLCKGDPDPQNFDEISDAWVCSVAEFSRPKAITMEVLEAESKRDEWIGRVKLALETNNWTDDLKKQEFIKNEFCFCDNVLLRGTKIVIPESLRVKTLELAHIIHSGESAMKALLRTKVWWPGIDEMVKKFVSKCRECILNSLPNPPEPLHRRQLPIAPWIDLATDFIGPFPTGEYILVVVDYYSRFQELEVMKGITASSTVKVFRKIFGRYGYPATLTADNGPQFISEDFKTYCEEVGVSLNTTTPYFPQQNGEVERQNRDIKRFCRIATNLNEDWRDWISDYQLMKNTMINDTTGKPPADLFFGRQIKTKLPLIARRYDEIDTEVRDRDFQKKQHGKEYADNKRHAKIAEIEPGDEVFLKVLSKRNKLESNFSPKVHKVLEKKGGEVVVENNDTKQKYRRSVTHVKKVPEVDEQEQEDDLEEVDEEPNEEKADELGAGSPVSEKKRPATEEIQAFRSKRHIKCPVRYRD